MKPIERNPDIEFDGEDGDPIAADGKPISEMPEGLTVVKGQWLQMIARARKVPWGLAVTRDLKAKDKREKTFGLVIKIEDEATIRRGIADRNAKKKKAAA